MGRNGTRYPIGLQCKKKSRWPVTSLSKADIDREVDLARGFTPALDAFYILTTAADDAKLQAHVRAINAVQKAAGSFEVVLLGWAEIVRRVSLDPDVANKHFGPSGSAHRSPLLGSWFLSQGQFEKPRLELNLDLRELIQDFRDWPNGRAVFRQKESDALLDQIAALGDNTAKTPDRHRRISLRDELHRLQRREASAALAVKMMLTDPELQSWLGQVWPPEKTVQSIRSLVLDVVVPYSGGDSSNTRYLRLFPPSPADTHISARLDDAAITAIRNIEAWRLNKFGKTLTDTVDELPDDVRASFAVPRIMRGVVEAMLEDFRTVDQLKEMGWFQLGRWRIEVA